MTGWEAALRAIGLFYAIGGLFMLRTLAAGSLIEAMLAALSGGATWRDRLRAGWLAGGGILTTVAGVALAALETSAVALMVVNAVAQCLWLGLAALVFPPEDDEDRLGRARTTRACILYLAALALVGFAIQSGRVETTAQPALRIGLAMLAAGLVAWQAWLRRFPGIGRVGDVPEDATDADGPLVRPVNLIVRPTLGAWPLWDEDDGRNLDPYRLGLPDDLVERINAFETSSIAVIDPDHDRRDDWRPDPADIARLEREAIALREALEAVFGEGHVAWALPEQLDR